MRQAHQYVHSGVAATVAKVRRYWIVRAHSLAKSVKHECVFRKKSQAQCETQKMADLPEIHLAPYTPHFFQHKLPPRVAKGKVEKICSKKGN